MKLNLGCNDIKIPGFIGVDVTPPADQIVDLCGLWPWRDSSVEEVIARDVFEHVGPCDHVSRWRCWRCSDMRKGVMISEGLGRPQCLPLRHWSGKAHVMNELHRVLVPGGRATLQIPHATLGDGGHCDPSHASYWTTSDFEYYTPGIAERERFRGSAYYGIKADFYIRNLTRRGVAQCVQCPQGECKGGHIPTVRYPRTFGGYVVEMQIVLEAVKS